MPPRRYRPRGIQYVARTKRTNRGMMKLRRYGQIKVPKNPNLYYYKQAINGNYITGISSRIITQGVGATFYGFEFQAGNLPNWSAFSALYDQYCITKFVIKLIPMTNLNGVQPLTGASLGNPGIIATLIDTDDGTALTTLAQMEQYQSYKSQAVISTKTITRTFVPGVDTTVIQTGGAAVNAMNKKLQWIDCSFSSIAHFGMKIYLDAYANANAPASYQVQGYCYIKFRNVR